MALAISIGQCSLVGNVRPKNEDSVEVRSLPNASLCIVADGMGGQNAGEVASQKAIELIPQDLEASLSKAADREAVRKAISAAVLHANETIVRMGQDNRTMSNMGTTVVLSLLWKENHLFIASLGDSRAYLIRGSTIKPLTTDHTLAQALVLAGSISQAEARRHHLRNVLWKYLGTPDPIEGPDFHEETLEPGDCLLLCTDGLYGVVPDEDLRYFIQSHPEPQACADGLGQLALTKGSRDNVSCIVIRAN